MPLILQILPHLIYSCCLHFFNSYDKLGFLFLLMSVWLSYIYISFFSTCFFLVGGPTPHGMWNFSDQRSKLCPLQQKCRVLTTELLGKSLTLLAVFPLPILFAQLSHLLPFLSPSTTPSHSPDPYFPLLLPGWDIAPRTLTWLLSTPSAWRASRRKPWKPWA